MKAKSIEISGMNNVTSKVYTFTDFTYLHGPNGAGKSTILEAINLALLGYIPGEDKKPAAVLKHSSINNLRVKLTFDDGSSIQRTFVKHGSGAQQIVEKNPEDLDIEEIIHDVELPVFNFNDFMSLSANAMKEWFLKFLPSQAVSIDWYSEIKKALASKSIEEIDSTKLECIVNAIESYDLSGLKEVQAANQFFKDNLSGSKKELDRVQKSLQSFSLMPSENTSASKEELENKIASWTSLKETQIHDRSIRQHNDLITKQISNLVEQGATFDSYEADPTFQKYKAEFENIMLENASTTKEKAELQNKYDLNKMQKDYKEKADEALSIKAKIDVLQKFVGQTTCPVLKKECTDLSNYSDQCSKEIEGLQKQENLVNQLSQELYQKYLDANKEITAVDLKLRSIDDRIRDIKNKTNAVVSLYNQKKQYEAMMQKPVSSETDSTDYDSLIREATNELQEIAQRDAAMSYYQETTKEVAECQKEVEQYKALVDLTSASELQAKLAAQTDPFDPLKDDMNTLMKKWISNFDTVYFNNEQKKNTFEFGIVRKGAEIPYRLMSSGEKCLISLALFISLVKISDTKLKLVMVDDAFDHLDDMTFSNLISALYDPEVSPEYQLIVAGIKNIQGKFVKEISSEN